jgi:hypothetical protein
MELPSNRSDAERRTPHVDAENALRSSRGLGAHPFRLTPRNGWKPVDPLVTIDGSSTPSRAVRVRGRASPPDEDAASWSRAVARRRTLAKGGASGAKPQQPQQRRRVGRGRPSVHELWRGGMLGQGALEAERRPSETRRCGHGQAPAAHVRSRRAAGCSGGRVV